MVEFQKMAKESHRMCSTYKTCIGCPMKAVDVNGSCFKWMMINPEEAENIIMQWSVEHPIKTNGMKFSEVFGFDLEALYSVSEAVIKWLNKEYKGGQDG